MKMFWDIALTGTERGFNKMGNSTLLNPQSSIQAIHEMNIMSGHHEPDRQEVIVIRGRSESGIRKHIIERTGI